MYRPFSKWNSYNCFSDKWQALQQTSRIIKYTTCTRCVLHMFVSKVLHKYENQKEREVNLYLNIRTSSHSYNVESQMCDRVVT